MKIISIFLLTIVLAQACNQEKDLKDAVLTYTATSRGQYKKIEIQNDKATIWHSPDKTLPPAQMTLTAEHQKALVAAFNAVDLENLPNLKAPSERRFHDGAAIGNFTIVYKGKTYESQPFDDGNPPAEIAALVNEATSFAREVPRQ